MTEEGRAQGLLRSGWIIRPGYQRLIIVLLVIPPMISFTIPELSEAWRSLMIALQAFGGGLFAAQVAPIWSRRE